MRSYAIVSSLCLETVIEDVVPKFIQKNRMNVRSGKGVWDVTQVATKQKAIVSIGKQRAQKWLVVGNRANMEDFFVGVFQSLIIFLPPHKPQLCFIVILECLLIHQFLLLSFIAPIYVLKINKHLMVQQKPNMLLEKL